ncbi:MAG: HD domain-containing phosphohydrolase [Halothiobacillaceae bacterium]
MQRRFEMDEPSEHVSQAELIGALSHALDLTEGQPPGHCLRCGWIGMQLAERLQLDADEAHDLFYTLLLKDLGCSSNAARIAALYSTDDLDFKRQFKRVDGGMPSVARFMLGQAAPGAPLLQRVGTFIRAVREAETFVHEVMEARCERGSQIARSLGFSEAVARGIYCLDEHHDGNGMPDGLSGSEIPLFSRIALLSQVAEVFHASDGSEAAREEVRRRRGTWFDPELVDAFLDLTADSDVWVGLSGPDLPERVFSLSPAQVALSVDDDTLDRIARGFAQVVDAKSPYTAGHSERVTEYADRVAEHLGLDEAQRRWLRRGSLLHDIGKLGVSNRILDKPDRPTEQEWAAIKAHPVHTEQILSRITPMQVLARMAGAHHERLDGRGYPKGLSGEQISLPTRILTVADVFDALTADRPYRPALSTEQALTIMAGELEVALDRDCFTALREVLYADGPVAE